MRSSLSEQHFSQQVHNVSCLKLYQLNNYLYHTVWWQKLQNTTLKWTLRFFSWWVETIKLYRHLYNVSLKWGTASCLTMLFPCEVILWIVLVQIFNLWATMTKLQRYSIFLCKGVHIQRDKRLHSSLPFPCKAVCCTVVTGLTIVHEGFNQTKALKNSALCRYLKVVL